MTAPGPPLRFGSLCTGYSGLDPAASRVLTPRFPAVPNLGDITAQGATAYAELARRAHA